MSFHVGKVIFVETQTKTTDFMRKEDFTGIRGNAFSIFLIFTMMHERISLWKFISASYERFCFFIETYINIF